MPRMKPEYVEKIYAGWLAKIIGIRLGAPVEGWTYEKIKNTYGALQGYPVNYRQFAADDDSNGPFFFVRALEDSGKAQQLNADDVAEALLNYAPFEHGFFWWGGYGTSTEHTAYLNLRHGMPAPRSGSIEQNGSTMAQQIGGQIFIDSWGLITPGQPGLAAKLAEQAASVTHGGEGVYGGIFVAACISSAFEETHIPAIIETGLSCIPQNCLYATVARQVMAFHAENPDDWEACFAWVKEKHGYDKYPGNCHIIPNMAVMILALLYGGGDFSATLNICNRCGWDTDCNVGNVATIMGVRGGLSAIGEDWRKPVDDFLALSSVVGSLNIQDIPFGALYYAKLAWTLAGEKLPQPWREIVDARPDSCHFEFPGSTHTMKARIGLRDLNGNQQPEFRLENTTEAAHTGARSLKLTAKPVWPGEQVCLYKQTHYTPADFHDSRYDPEFSPLLYPGQTVRGSVFLPTYATPCQVQLYARDARTGEMYMGKAVTLEAGAWAELSYTIPALEGALIGEAGFAFSLDANQCAPSEVTVLADDFYFDGAPEYSIDFAKETWEQWSPVHRAVSQFTRLKGHFYLDGGQANLSCADFGEVYTGHHTWGDYAATFTLSPVLGQHHYGCVRVQGGVRCYYAGFAPNGKLAILKNTRNGPLSLAETDFEWTCGKTYILTVTGKGAKLEALVGNTRLTAEDKDQPYLNGCAGLAVKNGSRLRCTGLRICPV